MTPTHITLKGEESKILLPSYADRADLMDAWRAAVAADDYAALRRVCAAALGLCVPRVARRADVGTWDGARLLSYGGRVLSSLHATGSPDAEIIEHATTLLRLVADSLVSEAEVKAKADFTRASEGG